MSGQTLTHAPGSNYNTPSPRQGSGECPDVAQKQIEPVIRLESPGERWTEGGRRREGGTRVEKDEGRRGMTSLGFSTHTVVYYVPQIAAGTVAITAFHCQ